MVVDVGGTNIRFGISETVSAPLSDIQSFECSNFTTIEEAAETYIASVEGVRDVNFDAVSIAVAAPIFGDHINVTNNHWQFIKSELINKIPAKSLLVVNDFVAQALAQADQTASKNQLIVDGHKRVGSPLLVIGPGTGLGVAALVPVKADYFIVEGEGGHARFTPHDGVEREFEAYLLKRQPIMNILSTITEASAFKRNKAACLGNSTPLSASAPISAAELISAFTPALSQRKRYIVSKPGPSHVPRRR